MNGEDSRVEARQESIGPEEVSLPSSLCVSSLRLFSLSSHLSLLSCFVLQGSRILPMPSPEYLRHSRGLGALLFDTAPPPHAKSIGSAGFTALPLLHHASLSFLHSSLFPPLSSLSHLSSLFYLLPTLGSSCNKVRGTPTPHPGTRTCRATSSRRPRRNL